MKVDCPHCMTSFQVPDSMVGGNVNCKSCRALIELSGAADGALYWTVVGLISLGWFGISAGIGVFENPVAGISMGLFGLLVLLVSVLVS